MVGELVDDPPGARVPDVELALHQRHRCAALCANGSGRASEQRVELALGTLSSLPLRARALFEDLLHEAGRALRLPEADDRIDLLVADERALDARRLPGVDRLI